MRFIANHCSLNQKLVIKPYTLPRIGKTMQQLEGFQYATALDINRRYCAIIISPANQYMTKRVNEFWKFRYNLLPLGMSASGDIFQSKLDDLLVDTEVVKLYINDILVLRNYCYKNIIEQQRIIFSRFRATGLKVNDPKCSFGLKTIPYLGYVIPT